MEYIVLVFVAAVLGTALAKWYGKSEYTWEEIAISMVGVLLISWGLLAAGTYSSLSDTEVLNGKVTGKEKVRVHCRHSYECHCYTSCSGYGKNRSCSRHCQTCYEHGFDNDWDVYTTVGNHSISTVDRQGLIEPPRWSQVIIGEDAHDTRTYVNYIKGAPESLFNKLLLVQDKYPIPNYPSSIYDYYRINRVVEVAVHLDPAVKAELNSRLNLMLRDLGPQKEVNVVPVFTSYDANFARALEAAWLGGKKNDIVVVVGLNKDQTINWTYVFSWSKKSIVNYEIKNSLEELDNLDPISYTAIVEKGIKTSFVRRSMNEFEYLKDSIVPPTWCLVTALMLAFFGALGAGVFFSQPQNRFNRY